MRLLLISDTHGALEKSEEVIAMEQPDLVLHMGDIGYDEHYLPDVYYVKGNNDKDSIQPKERTLSLLNHVIYITHGDLYEMEAVELLKSRGHEPYANFDICMETVEEIMANAGKKHGADIVCFGHTHFACNRIVDGVLLINPGSLLFSHDGTNVSYAVLTLKKGSRQAVIKYIKQG